jgi:hypothetical protein
MTIRKSTRLLVVALVVLPVGLAACGGENTGVSGRSSTEVSGPAAAAGCAMIVRYDGHKYIGTGVRGTPVEGDSLGNGTFPPCNDTGGLGDSSDGEQVPIAEVQGVSPSIAIMLAGRPDVVLVRDDVELDALPKDVFPR